MLADSPRLAAQRQALQTAFGGGPELPAWRPTPERSGLPGPLQAGLEALSGIDLSDVQVHARSDEPARLNALAFARGNQIHLAPGQERQLPHEAWHVVQQRQGRVPATGRLGATVVNTDRALELEADLMGHRAARPLEAWPQAVVPGRQPGRESGRTAAVAAAPVAQLAPVEHSKVVSDAPYGWTSKYEIDIRADEAVLTIRVQVNPDADVTAKDVTQVKKQTRTEMQRQWDRRFNLKDAADKLLPLRIQLEYVTANPHATVALHAGAGHDDLSNWFVGSDSTTRAHELGHQMGMLDEYVDATAPNRATAASPGVFSDNSLMGNYYTEGIGKAHAKQRHGDLLASDISATTGTAYTAVASGIYITREGDTLSSIALRLLGKASKWRDLYNKNAGVIGKDPDKIRPGLTLQLP